MLKAIIIIAALVLVLHGLIHLIGPTVYMRLGTVKEIAYKTTLLGGRWDVGERGIWIFGALWVVPAVGFVLAAVGILVGWSWWQSLLLVVTFVSLLLTVLDWRVAYAGAVVNLIILVMLLLEPRIANWFVG